MSRCPTPAVFLVGLLLAAGSVAQAQPAVKGEWTLPFATPNVMIHTSVLPTGKVLFWSRREAGEGLNPRACTPRVWDPAAGTGAGAFSETKKQAGV